MQSYVNNYADHIRDLKLSKDMFGISKDRLGTGRMLSNESYEMGSVLLDILGMVGDLKPISLVRFPESVYLMGPCTRVQSCRLG